MERDLSGYTTDELLNEIQSRGQQDEVLELVDSDELKDELYARGEYIWNQDFEEVDDATLLDELESRGYFIPDQDITALVRTIHQQKRTGRPFDTELDKVIYEITGRFI